MDNLMLITVIETKLYLPLEVKKDRVCYCLAIHNLEDLLENKEKLCIEQFKLRNVEWYDIVSPFDFDRVNTWFLKQKLVYEKKYSWQLDLRNINMMPNVCDYFGKKFSEMRIGEWYTNAVKTFYYMKIDAMTFEQSLPQYVVVGIPLFRLTDLKEYSKKLEYLNTRHAKPARVYISPVGWEKTSDNVSGYLVKNKLVDELNLWYNKSVFRDVKDTDKITECDEETYYMQYKNQLDNETFRLFEKYWMPKLFRNTFILLLGIKKEDYQKVLQCMKQEKELQFGAVFRRLNVRVGYYNSKTKRVEETRFNDIVNNWYLHYLQHNSQGFKDCRAFCTSSAYHKLVPADYVIDIKFA